MKKLTYKDLRQKWFDFFESKNHKKISGSSLIPDGDSSVLFTTAGMQPLTPYLMGKSHPQGKRLVNIQRCIRTNDIAEVGDSSHSTFFEMMGNWSLGDYFKKESIEMSYEFLTSEKYLAIPKDKIAVTVFEGDDQVNKDVESYNIWKSLGIPEEKIFFLGKKDNWWAAGDTGPCGPDTEMFYINENIKCDDPENCTPACDCGRFLEVWNNVFMQYNVEKPGQKPVKLENKNVDTGMGLERTLAVLNGYESIYDSEIFANIIDFIESNSKKKYKENDDITKKYRIILDHMRASTFIMGDEQAVSPSNTGRGYILRRLIRRSIMQARNIEFSVEKLVDIVNMYIDFYGEYYPTIESRKEKIINDMNSEVSKFENTIKQGIKEFNKVVSKLRDNTISGRIAFRLYDTFGFPFELTKEMAEEKGLNVDKKGFDKAFKKHQEASKSGLDKTFKGGLADGSYETVKYHTATHLVLAALKEMYGDHIEQRGSNITSERMRFDFNLDHKMTEEEKNKLEEIVNREIKKEHEVINEQMPIDEARKQGATGIFDSKYDEKVSVYTIGGFSKELCGGPHVKNTKELGEFKLKKEQSSSAGIRRIKAILK